MLDRLWFRLLLGMSLALALAVGTVALLTNRATSESFAEYVEDVSAARAMRVERVLERQYQRTQSWNAVEPVVQLVADLAGQRVVLADNSGRVVADSQNQLVGQRAQPDWAGDPVIVTYQETPVGSVYLDPLRPRSRVDTRGQTFLSAINQYLIWAAVVGLLAALILSLLLSRWLASPLEALTRAARRMERGDLSQSIDVRIGGEIGALAHAFNSTAASLARVESLRKQMVADIAHELRTPLTNIRGYLEAIADGVAEPSEETLNILKAELAQLTRLVDDLEELALAEAGKLKLSREDIDPRDAVVQQLRALQPQADGRGVALVPRFAPSLPRLSADAGRLGQAVGNVLRNALAHTPRGGRITASVTAEDRSVVMRVSDTGRGIPPEHLPHIFERFYRGDPSRARPRSPVGNGPSPGNGLAETAHGGGYGLGLTISRELIQAHGGQITAESRPGEGAEFTIRLPLAPTPARQPSHDQPLGAKPWPVTSYGLSQLLRNGVLVSALFGAGAGLIEAGLLAIEARKAQSFADLFGYAVMIDAAAFGALGALGTVLCAASARLFRRRLDPVWHIRMWVPIGFVLVGLMTYVRWRQFYNREETLAVSPSQALFTQVAILGVAGLLALLASTVLAPRRGSDVRVLVFGQRLAPGALAVVVGLSAVGVVRDLGGRGLGVGASAVAASADRQSATSASAPNRGLPSAKTPAGGRSPGGDVTAPTLAGPLRPNVMLVTIDSLRADHVGFTGYSKAKTPTLDRLASEGVYFTNTIVNQPGSNPSHASILTGTYPATHGIRSHMVDLLSSDVPTIGESFAAQGYVTAGIFSWLSFEPAYSGLNRGFQVYTNLTVNRPAYLSDSRTSTLAATYKRLKTMLALPGAMDRQMSLSEQVEDQLDGKADVTTDGLIDWLEEYQSSRQASGKPFFLWAHYFDPHYPYTPPPPFDEIEPDDCVDCLDGSMPTIRKIAVEEPDFDAAQINRLLQYYDGEIAFTDSEFGRLLQAMRTMGLEQDTLVVVLGDHGESFGEHGRWLHGESLHGSEIHVPMIIRFPQRLPAGKSIDAVAQQIDIVPTLLDLLELPVPAKVEGRSLLPLIADQEHGDDRYAVAELGDRSIVSLVTREWRLLKNTRDGAAELYRVVDDPDEQRDLADAEPEVVAELEQLVEEWRAAHP
jgi:signal transduction histidine kinase/arylsulfatase A-like enzyme